MGDYFAGILGFSSCTVSLPLVLIVPGDRRQGLSGRLTADVVQLRAGFPTCSLNMERSLGGTVGSLHRRSEEALAHKFLATNILGMIIERNDLSTPALCIRKLNPKLHFLRHSTRSIKKGISISTSQTVDSKYSTDSIEAESHTTSKAMLRTARLTRDTKLLFSWSLAPDRDAPHLGLWTNVRQSSLALHGTLMFNIVNFLP